MTRQKSVNFCYVMILFLIAISIGPIKIILVKNEIKESNELQSTHNPISEHFYGGNDPDYVYSLIQTIDGGFLLVGETQSYGAGRNDMWLIKTDSNGIIQWNQTYGGNEYDSALTLVQSPDGGFLLAGYSNSFNNRLDVDVWLVKTDFNGKMKWNRTFGGLGEDIAISITYTEDNDIVLAGISSSYGLGGADIWVLRTDSNGILKWNKTYGEVGEEGVNDLIQTSDGGFAIVGYLMVTFRRNPVAFASIHLKIDESGTLEWMRYYGDPLNGDLDDIMTQLNCILQTSDQGFVIGGSYGSKMFLVKTNKDGMLQWNRTFDTDVAYQANGLVKTLDGDLVLTGCADPEGIGKSMVFLTKTTPNGIKQWQQTVPMDYSALVESIIIANTGKYVIIGSVLTSNYESDAFLLILKDIQSNSDLSSLLFRIGFFFIQILTIGVLLIYQRNRQ